MNPGEELRYLILAVQREGNRQLTDLLRDLKLTPSQAEVLLVLQQCQPITLTELGERLVCETGSPSRLVKSMVESGWVEKLPSPRDGRAIQLRLTSTAEAVLPVLNQIDQQFNARIAASFDSEALRTVLDHLWPLVVNTAGGAALRRRRDGL
jgi:DNA-binding MarR family transcriptional regulator